jgi:hypothetical protein
MSPAVQAEFETEISHMLVAVDMETNVACGYILAWLVANELQARTI